MDKNVQIPLSLLNQSIDFLEDLDVSGLCDQTRSLYDDIYSAFINKKMSLCLRDSYVKIINANSDSERKHARTEYLINKRFSK